MGEPSVQRSLILPVTLVLSVLVCFLGLIVGRLYDFSESAVSLPTSNYQTSIAGRASVNTKELTSAARSAANALSELAGTNLEVSNLITSTTSTVNGRTTSALTKSSASIEALVKFIVSLMRVYSSTPWIGVGFADGSLYAAKRTSTASDTIIVLIKDVENTLAKGTNLRNYPLDSTGYLYDLNSGSDSATTGYTPETRSWYTNTVSQDQACWGQPTGGSGVYSDAESGELVVSATVPIYASGTTTLLGVALGDIRLSDISTYLQTLSFADSGRIFIVENVSPFYLIGVSEGTVATTDSSSSAKTSCLCTDGISTRLKACESSSSTIRDGWDVLEGHFGSGSTLSSYNRTGGPFESGTLDYESMIQSTIHTDAYGLDWAVVTVIPGEDYYSFIRTDLWFTLPVGALVFIAICSTFYRYTHTEIESTRLLNKTVGGVLVMALLLWVVWAVTIRHGTDKIVEDSLVDSGLHAQDQVMFFYDKHLRANHLNAHLNTIGAIDIGTTGVSARTALDSHFLTLLRSLRQVSNATSVYVGIASTGEMLGATYYNDVTICVMTQAANSDLIYYGTTGSGASETRDAGNEIARYTSDPDARKTTWYTEGTSQGQISGSTLGNTGLTPVYAFENLFMHVSVVTPFYDTSNNLLGVLGVDSTFDSVNGFLLEALASSSGVYLAMERLAELVSSSSEPTVGLDSNARLRQLNATDSDGASVEVDALFEVSKNMTAAQNQTHVVAATNLVANVYCSRSGSRYVAHLNSYFNSILARWTLLQVEERETYYKQYDAANFTMFSLVFFLTMFLLIVVVMLLRVMVKKHAIFWECVVDFLDRRKSSRVAPEARPWPGVPEVVALRTTYTPVEVYSRNRARLPESQKAQGCSEWYHWFRLMLLEDRQSDIHEMKAAQLLKLARRRLQPIVNRLILEEDLVDMDSDYDTGAGVEPPLPPLKIRGMRLSKLSSEILPAKAVIVDAQRLQERLERRKARLQEKAIHYMLQADSGNDVFQLMTLESHLGEDHILTQLHGRYLGTRASRRVFTLRVLVYTVVEVALADVRAATIPVQALLNVFFTSEGILMAYVEYLTDGFVRDHLVLRVMLLLLMWITFLYHAASDQADVHNMSALLCPFYFLVRSPGLRTAAGVIVRALISANTVFYLLFFTVAVTAIMLNLFFYKEFSGGLSTQLGSSANDFWDSMISMFVYLCGGENYEDLVFQGYSATQATWLFFLPLGVLGNFFLMTLVIATFQDTHRKHKQRIDHMNRSARRLVLCSSFVLWTWDNLDNKPGITHDDFVELLRQYWKARKCSFQSVKGSLDAVQTMKQSLRSFSLAALCSSTGESQRAPEEEMAAEIFSTIDSDSSGAIEFSEFVLVLAVSRCVEMLRKRGGDNSLNDQLRGGRVIAAKWESQLESAKNTLIVATRTGKKEEKQRAAREKLDKLSRFFLKAKENLKSLQDAAEQSSLICDFMSWTYMNYALLSLILIQGFILSLYGNDDDVNQRAILHACNALNLVYPVEMILRIRSVGDLTSYLYDGRRPWTSMLNFLHLGFVVGTTLGTIPTFFLPEVPQRIATGVIALNLFRAFLLEEKVAKLLYSFSFGFRPLQAYVGLFFVIFYSFSWLAFQMFEDKVNKEYRNFNTFGDTLLTMFQVFLGEAWYLVMEAAVRPTTRLNVWFFVAYVIVARMLVADFMIGIIIDLFHSSRQRSETHTGQVEMIFAEHCESLDEHTKADLIRSLGWVGSVLYQPVMKNLAGLKVLEHKFGEDILQKHEGNIKRWAANVLMRRLSSAGRWRAKKERTANQTAPPTESASVKRENKLSNNVDHEERRFARVSRRRIRREISL